MSAADPFAAPTKVDKVDLAFPARGVELTPPYAMAPDEFKGFSGEWVALTESLFFGRADDLAMVPADGIDAQEAWDHISVVLGCFGTKHEHKIAGAAWLLSRWFVSVTYAVRGEPVKVGAA